MESNWKVYLLKCSDETIYCGITNNLEKRIKTHNSKMGAKYTRGRLPVILIKSFDVPNKSEALKLEFKIKKLSREEKLKYDIDKP
jgi:putative endonuclease